MKLIAKLIIGLLFTFALCSAAVSDIKNREIPNMVNISLLLLGIFRLLVSGMSLITLANATAGTLIAGIPLLIVAVKTNGLGGGDVKLAACGGFFLKLYPSCSALLFSLFLFLLFSVLYIKVRKLDWKASLPFAPFYAIAGVSVYFLTQI